MYQQMGSHMVEEALHCLAEADTFTAVEFLNQQPAPAAVAGAYNELVKRLYWQQRNISQVVAMGRAGIQYCSDKAEEAAAAGDMEQAFALRSAAKQLAYNLASYTWPGWDEPDLELEAMQVAAGLDAARQNLRLALELDKGDLPLARAYWMLGAHLLAITAYAGAEANFRRAELYANRADAPAESMLAHAFASLAYWMLNPESEGHRLTYEKARDRLAVLQEAAAFQAQVEGARRVFMT
jgi:hypothetical protein